MAGSSGALTTGLNLCETWVGASALGGAELGQTRGSWPVAVCTALLVAPRLFSELPGSRGPGGGLPRRLCREPATRLTSPDTVTHFSVSRVDVIEKH